MLCTPIDSKAEHSMYCFAPISLDISIPWAVDIASNPRSFSLLIDSSLVRKSIFVPIKRIGTFGQWSRSSGMYLVFTF